MGKTAERLILFTRYPEPGATKTRLIPVLGPEGAAEFQRRLTERAARTAQEVRTNRRLSLEIRHEGGSEASMRQWLGSEFSFRPQGSGDIGARMQQSLKAAFAEGAQHAVIIGSDIPGLTSATVVRAFDALDRHDLVFGPAADGGYY
ncbi:MAG: TIGR04282 family arsenosugar biosynthesis glycosyltransferase, partial [Hyphomicrobiales bacterium]